MKGDRLKANVLAVRLIPNVDSDMAKELGLPNEHRSIGILTADCDDVTYTALDEATKKAVVDVAYGKLKFENKNKINIFRRNNERR